jgi:hypothetical protein
VAGVGGSCRKASQSGWQGCLDMASLLGARGTLLLQPMTDTGGCLIRAVALSWRECPGAASVGGRSIVGHGRLDWGKGGGLTSGARMERESMRDRLTCGQGTGVRPM